MYSSLRHLVGPDEVYRLCRIIRISLQSELTNECKHFLAENANEVSVLQYSLEESVAIQFAHKRRLPF